MGLLLKWVVGVIAVVITVQVLNAIGVTVKWQDSWGMIVFVPVLAVVNAVIGGILRLFSMPITCITLGLFGFVINAIVFWIAGVATGADMGFLAALAGSILYTVISSPLSSIIKDRRRRD